MDDTYKIKIEIEKEDTQLKEELDEENELSIKEYNKSLEENTNPTYVGTSYISFDMTQKHLQETLNGNESKLNKVGDKLRLKIEKGETEDYYYKTMFEVEDNKQWIDQLDNTYEIETNPNSIGNSYLYSAINYSDPQKYSNEYAYNIEKTCAETIARVNVDKMSGYHFEPLMTVGNNDHKSQHTLNERVHTEKKPYSCDVCLKSFSQKSSLTLHKRVHTAEKNYNREICLNSFSDKFQFSTHKLLQHTGEKLFNCDLCLKLFSQKSSLTLNKGVHTVVNNYKCEFCLNSFSDKFQLSTHKLLQHTGEKPYSCDVCLKSFSQKSSLSLHKRMHTGENKYKCDFCLKSFSDKSYLSMHKTVHSGEKHYKCDVCLKSFTQKSSLILHKRVHIRNIKLPQFTLQTLI